MIFQPSIFRPGIRGGMFSTPLVGPSTRLIRSAAFIGSSSVEQFNAVTSGSSIVNMRVDGFGVWCCGFLRQRMMLAYNPTLDAYHFGLYGASNTTQLTDSRLTPAAIAAQPDVAFIYTSLNDLANPVITIQNMLDSTQAIYNALIAGGVKTVVIIAPGPRDAGATGGSGYYARQQSLIASLTSWTSSAGIKFANCNSYIQNPSTGDWLTGYSYDGVHPGMIGAMQLGRGLAEWCLANLPLGPEPLAGQRLSSLVGSNPFNTGGTSTLAAGYTRSFTSATAPFLEAATDGGARWQGVDFYNPNQANWLNNSTIVTGATVPLATAGLSTGQLVRSWVEVNFSGGLQRIEAFGIVNGTATKRSGGPISFANNPAFTLPQWPAVAQNLVFAGPVTQIPSDATVINNTCGITANMTGVPSQFKFRYLGFEAATSRNPPAIGT
jgi:lysophospholipase L1-like esterase